VPCSAIPWFNPKFETVVLRGLAVGEMYEDQYVFEGDRRRRLQDDDEDEEVDSEREFTLYPVNLIYEDLATDNLITKANIDKIIRVEKAILNVNWESRCTLVYPGDEEDEEKVEDARCKSPTTILNYLFVDEEQHKEQCKDGFCQLPDSSVGFCGNVTGLNWGTPPCFSTVFDWSAETAELADEADWNDLLDEKLCKPGRETKFLLDKFNEDCEGEEDIMTKYSRSRYDIGWPLKGFKDRDDRPSQQRASLEGGLFGRGTYGPALLDSLSNAISEVSATSLTARTFATRARGDKTINVFLNEGVTGREVDIQFQAVFLSILSLIFVFFYIWFNVGSLFLAFTGTFEIIASLPLAWFFWRVILWQLRLDIFAFSLIIFLILCIGADDIFVFMDTWKASRSKPPHISGSIESRLQWTYGQAASAMFTTTATTVLALLMTATSSIPFIASFGIFGALVVIFDYALVISWFPVTVIVYHRYFEKGCWRNWCACMPVCKVVAAEEEGQPVPERKSVIFIRDTIAPRIHKFRIPIFVVGCALVVAMTVTLGALYEVADNFPDFYVPTHPFAAYGDISDEAFFQADDWRHQVTMVYGFDPDKPVNRSLNGQLTLDIINEEKLVRNDVPFNINAKMADALVKDCEDLEENVNLVFGRQRYCLLNEVKVWSGSKWPYDDEEELREALDKFYDSTRYEELLEKEPAFARATGFNAQGDTGIRTYWVTYNVTIPQEAASGPDSLKKWQVSWEHFADEESAAPAFPHMQQPPINRPVNWEFMRIM
jgi:hypothetical protein